MTLVGVVAITRTSTASHEILIKSPTEYPWAVSNLISSTITNPLRPGRNNDYGDSGGSLLAQS
jgi:hypothetical protein